MRIKKMLTTAIITAAVAVTAIALNPAEAHAATGWNKNNTGWWWENADGSYPTNAWKQVGGTWYYFDDSGYMLTGWQKINGTWYYMDNSGAMLTGWQQINGTWYYMYDSGAMASDTYIGSYYVDASGAWITDNSATALSGSGWIKDNTGWWYRHEDGSYTRNGWEKINGTWYYFNASGYMHTGWIKSGKYWYYLQPSGAMAKNMYIGDNYVDMSGKWLTGAEKDKYLQALEVAQGIAAEVSNKSEEEGWRVFWAAQAVSNYCDKGTYTTEGNNYYTAYGVFIIGEYSCAGATRALGMVLECMGYEWEHVNENQWTHQWCKLEIKGETAWADGQMGVIGYGERQIK